MFDPNNDMFKPIVGARLIAEEHARLLKESVIAETNPVEGPGSHTPAETPISLPTEAQGAIVDVSRGKEVR